jgi:hypothetical protein
LYGVTGKGLSIQKSLISGSRYPDALMEDIAEFISQEFSPGLRD